MLEALIKYQEIRKKIGKTSRKEVSKYTSDVVKHQWFDLIEKK